jgi:predicted permease
VTFLVPIFSNNLLPIFLAAGAGYLLGKFYKIDPAPISRILFYIFSPCLVFDLLANSQLNGQDVAVMVTICIINVVLVGILTWLVVRALRFDRQMQAAVLITAMFANAGNYGLSLNHFAFGDDALAYASLYFVTSAVLIYTLGIIIASLGTASTKETLIGLLKIPTIYALLLGFLALKFDWTIPLPIERTINLLSDASIPCMLVLLGLQLKRVRWGQDIKPLSVSLIMRMVISPLIVLGLTFLFNVYGPARQAAITEAATPTAVLTTVLATEYNLNPAFITAVVTVSTLVSPLTLTPILSWLGG